MRKIIDSTDGKHIGKVFNETRPIYLEIGVLFDVTKVQKLDNELIRYSNSNYVILTKTEEE